MSSKELETNSLSAIHHILLYRPERIRLLRTSQKPDGRVGEIYRLAKETQTPVDPSLSKHKDEAIAYLKPFEYEDFSDFVERHEHEPQAMVLALDHIQDTQNLGALARTAEGLGVSGLILPKDRSVGITSGAYQTSVGAIETLPISQVANLGEALRKLKGAGFWIVGTTLDEEATAPEDVPDFNKIVLILGSELDGMSPGILKLCDWKVKIPILGKIESLNVSSAGSILMYELIKRVHSKNKN